jgi:glutathione S-transferase
MYILHHFPLCPLSRLARIMLAEKQLSFKLIEEKPWERSVALSQINPAMEVPVLIAHNQAISSIYAICEYLESVDPQRMFFAADDLANAEIRRLVSWFCCKFYNEVTKYIFEEKVVLHYVGQGSPRTNFIRAARTNLNYHLDYIEFLLKHRKWLAGNNLSLADLAAATQISTLDYLGDVHWDKHQLTKEWYAVLKSRPSFRTLLVDRIKGFTPPAHYQNLDF